MLPHLWSLLTTASTRSSTDCKDSTRFSWWASISAIWVGLSIGSDRMEGGLSLTSLSLKEGKRGAFSPLKVLTSRGAGTAGSCGGLGAT